MANDYFNITGWETKCSCNKVPDMGGGGDSAGERSKENGRIGESPTVIVTWKKVLKGVA
jgi:hypothetical protein